jgi:hypothetical protein
MISNFNDLLAATIARLKISEDERGPVPTLTVDVIGTERKLTVSLEHDVLSRRDKTSTLTAVVNRSGAFVVAEDDDCVTAESIGQIPAALARRGVVLTTVLDADFNVMEVEDEVDGPAENATADEETSTRPTNSEGE